MHMLTKSEVLALQPGDDEYFVELRRLWEPAAVLVWSGMTKFYIQWGPAYRKMPERLATIVPLAFDWAEGGSESKVELNTAEDPDDPPTSVLLKFELGFN